MCALIRKVGSVGERLFRTGRAISLAAAPLVLLGACGGPGDESGLAGLWEVTSIRNVTKGEPQAHGREFHLFSDTHQMVILAGEDRPKLPKSLSDMSPEEFQSQQPIGAGLYRIEVEGNRIVRTNVVALSAFYEGRSFVGEIEVGADSLVLRDSHSADGHTREWTMRRVQ